MDAFLESILLLFIVFRWLTLAFGIVLLILLIYSKKHRKDNSSIWLIYLGIMFSILIVLFSIYQISGIDFGLFPDSIWF